MKCVMMEYKSTYIYVYAYMFIIKAVYLLLTNPEIASELLNGS